MATKNNKEGSVEVTQLRWELARLESLNDQLITELRYTDNLLRAVGFCQGLRSLKQAAEEWVEDLA
jgi:hypothetical protein